MFDWVRLTELKVEEEFTVVIIDHNERFIRIAFDSIETGLEFCMIFMKSLKMIQNSVACSSAAASASYPISDCLLI